MLLTILLTPFLFISTALGLALSVEPQSPSVNSQVQIIWTVQYFGTPQAPLNFTLVLLGPDSQRSQQNVIVSGQRSASEEMSVTGPGSYTVDALWPIEPPNTQIGNPPAVFQVTAGPTLFTTSQSSTSSSISISSVETPTSTTEHKTEGVQDLSNTSTSDTVNTSATATTTTNSYNATTKVIVFSTPSMTSPVLGQSLNETDTDPNILSHSPSPSPSSVSSLSSSSSSSRGIIVGSVLGGFTFFIFLAVIFLRLWKRWYQNEGPVTFNRDRMVRAPGLSPYGPSTGESLGRRSVSPSLGEKGPYGTTMDDTTSDLSYVDSAEECQSTSPSMPSTMNYCATSDPFGDSESVCSVEAVASSSRYSSRSNYEHL